MEEEYPEAWLKFHYAGRKDEEVSIRRDDQFDIGRHTIQDTYGIDDLAVSKHHLRIHCVVFDDQKDRVALIYARVLSQQTVQLLSTSEDKTTNIRQLRKSDGDILLLDRDKLLLTPQLSVVFYLRTAHHVTHKLTDCNRAEMRQFAAEYEVTDHLLGSGGFGGVFLAIHTRDRQQVACKVVSTQSKPGIDSTSIAKREREFNILKNLSHPNIIQLKKVFYCQHYFYIMSELITGGDLLAWCERNGPATEGQTAVIIRQLLKAIEYLHERGITHRDIKPENVLVTSWKDGARIVLTDFGGAIEDASHQDATVMTRMFTNVGTSGYIAPEVGAAQCSRGPRTGYSNAVDIWSIGCIAGSLPTRTQLFSESEGFVQSLNVDKASPYPPELLNLCTGESWKNFSCQMKDFIKSCLILDETKRLSAKAALAHAWFTNKHYANEMEASYQSATKAWKPHKGTGSLIERISPDSSMTVMSKRLADETKSCHFTPQNPRRTPLAHPELKTYHAHTPLPAIAEMSADDSCQTPTITRISKQEAMLEDTCVVPGTPPSMYPPCEEYSSFSAYDNLQSSLDQYAPPRLTQTSPRRFPDRVTSIETQIINNDTMLMPPPSASFSNKRKRLIDQPLQGALHLQKTSQGFILPSRKKLVQ